MKKSTVWNHGCLKCGECCRTFPRNSIQADEVKEWLSDGKYDLLDVYYGQRKQPCEFFRNYDGTKVCIIEDHKPQVCRSFICKKVKDNEKNN